MFGFWQCDYKEMSISFIITGLKEAVYSNLQLPKVVVNYNIRFKAGVDPPSVLGMLRDFPPQ